MELPSKQLVNHQVILHVRAMTHFLLFLFFLLGIINLDLALVERRKGVVF